MRELPRRLHALARRLVPSTPLLGFIRPLKLCRELRDLTLDKSLEMRRELRPKSVWNERRNTWYARRQPRCPHLHELPSQSDTCVQQALEGVFAQTDAHASITRAHDLIWAFPQRLSRRPRVAEPRKHGALRARALERAFRNDGPEFDWHVSGRTDSRGPPNDWTNQPSQAATRNSGQSTARPTARRVCAMWRRSTFVSHCRQVSRCRNAAARRGECSAANRSPRRCAR